jgi:hypothetical protein
MWDVLSADFDTNITGEACLGYVYTTPNPVLLLYFMIARKHGSGCSMHYPKCSNILQKKATLLKHCFYRTS